MQIIMQWSPNFSKNNLEFDFDHEIMIMITLFDRVFFLICEATYNLTFKGLKSIRINKENSPWTLSLQKWHELLLVRKLIKLQCLAITYWYHTVCFVFWNYLVVVQ